MASKGGKSEEKITDKLKNLFRINKDKHVATTFQKPPTKDFVLTAEILKDIGPEGPGNNRIKTLKEFSDVVLKRNLEEYAVEAIWSNIQDLVVPQAVSEKRHVALHFLKRLIEGQNHQQGVLRGHFFHVIEGIITLPENTSERLELFRVLSEGGRNLVGFEEEAGPFLLNWMPEVMGTDILTDFLSMLISIIRFNTDLPQYVLYLEHKNKAKYNNDRVIGEVAIPFASKL